MVQMKRKKDDAMGVGKKQTRNYLDDYLTFGELAGKIPASLMVNVDFEKFASMNGFEPIDQVVNLRNDN